MRLIIAAAVLGLSAAGACSEQADRYTMEKTADGYVRLDTRTGEMSICRETGTQLVCQLAADDRLSLEDEIARLEDRLAALEKRVEAVEGKQSFSLPTQEDMDKTVSVMQRFFQGFLGVVKEFERDMGEPAAPGPAPDRT